MFPALKSSMTQKIIKTKLDPLAMSVILLHLCGIGGQSCPWAKVQINNKQEAAGMVC